jgi:hypothetical protein
VSAHPVDFSKRLEIVAEDLWNWKQSHSVSRLRSRCSPLPSRLQELFLRSHDGSNCTVYLEEVSHRIYEAHIQHLQAEHDAWIESRVKSEWNIGSSKYDLLPAVSLTVSGREEGRGRQVPSLDSNDPTRLEHVDLTLLNSRESSVSDYLTFQESGSLVTKLSRILKQQNQQPISLPSSPTFHRGQSPRLSSPSFTYIANPSYFVPKHNPPNKGRQLPSTRPLRSLPSLPDPQETHEVYELVLKLFTQSLLPLHSRPFLEDLLQNWLSIWSPLPLARSSSLRASESRTPPSPLLLTETSLLVTLFFLFRTSYDCLTCTTGAAENRESNSQNDRSVSITQTHLRFQKPLVFHLLGLDFESIGCLFVPSASSSPSSSSAKHWDREEIKSFSDSYGAHLDPDIFLIICCRLGYPELMAHCLHSIFTNPLSNRPSPLSSSLPSSVSPAASPPPRTVFSFHEILNYLPKFMQLEPSLCYRLFCSLPLYLSPWLFQALLISLEHNLLTKFSNFESYLSVSASILVGQPPLGLNPTDRLDESAFLFSHISLDSNELCLLLLLEVIDPPSSHPSVTALCHNQLMVPSVIHLSGYLISSIRATGSSDPQQLVRRRCYESLVARLLRCHSHEPLQHSGLSAQLLGVLTRWSLHELAIDFIADLLLTGATLDSSAPEAAQTLAACEEYLLQILPALLRSFLDPGGGEGRVKTTTCACALRLLFQLRSTRGTVESRGGASPFCSLFDPFLSRESEAASLPRIETLLESALGPIEADTLLQLMCGSEG